jgi:uncharacterized protein YdaU (DUF1376 family)
MRDAPSSQEYAAAMLANANYRMMTLAERGLLDTLRCECWVNGSLPEDPTTLAKMLSFDQAEIAAALPAIMPFFVVKDGKIVCPELEDLRATYADRRERMATGGKRSADKRRSGNAADTTASTLQAPSKHPASSLQGRRPDQTKLNQSKAVAKEEVVPCKEYEEWTGGGTDPDEYRRAADGG